MLWINESDEQKYSMSPSHKILVFRYQGNSIIVGQWLGKSTGWATFEW